MAASAGAVRAGKAFVELFADKSKFVKTLRSAEKDFKAFGTKLMSIGKGIFLAGSGLAAAMVPAVAVFAAAGSAVDDMSQRTGIAADQLLSLKYAAEQSGSSLEDVEKGVRKMQDSLAQAAAGNATAAASFGKLGLNVRQLLRMKPDQQFRVIADRLSMIQNPALRTGAAMDVFGKSAADLMPLIAGGGAAMAALEQESRDLGLTMSKDDVSAAAKLGDMWDTLTSIGKGLYMQIGAALAPVLIEIADTLIQAGKGALKFVKENKQLIITIVKITAGVVAAGAAIFVAGAAIVALGAVAGSIITLVTSTVAAMTAAWAVLTATVGFLMTPLGAVFAAVVAGGAAFLYFSGAGSKAFGMITDAAKGLAADFSKAWGGIVDAVMAGDLEAAANIVWLGVQLQFQKVVTALKEAWLGLSMGMMTAWDIATNAIAQQMIDVSAKIQSAWTEAFGVIMLQVEQLKEAFKLLSSLVSINFGVTDMNAALGLVQDFVKESQGRAGNTALAIKGKQSSIESDRKQQQGDLSAAFNHKLTSRALGTANSITDSEKALAKAQKEFADAIDGAAVKRAEMESSAKTGKVPLGGGDFDFGTPGQRKQAVAGTFSGAAASRMGGSGTIFDPNTNILRQLLTNNREQLRAQQKMAGKRGAVFVD
ncbi:MAG: hypothetical protein SH850_10750 [Planctomycetaceae bacterium]|nr:hypothetical protein [Planctomycetaceae bacterium]